MTQRRRLSAGEIAEMRRLFDAGHLIADLTKAYGVHRSVVDRIVRRKTHAAVSDDLEPIIGTSPE